MGPDGLEDVATGTDNLQPIREAYIVLSSHKKKIFIVLVCGEAVNDEELREGQ
jgi:hypothetical protein